VFLPLDLPTGIIGTDLHKSVGAFFSQQSSVITGFRDGPAAEFVCVDGYVYLPGCKSQVVLWQN